MTYQVLSQDEQDDIIASFMLSQERDKFCHELNLARYEAMLEVLPEGEWKQRVASLRNETQKRLGEVNDIIAASLVSMPSSERVEASKQRMVSKEDKQQ
ncbi:MAG: hypothetical protein PHI12_06905 [Dehalococcoidales bacterium]|nr:hypothetical protein [Dehalococcoidales bacterium]